MKLTAYYNEVDQFCCDWLSNLMDDGLITPGFIDNRSIEDVLPHEVEHYERAHWFAGIGIWDLALNLAGWTGSVWSGSCPCQPFSAAGKGGGFDDERHLWPAFHWLIAQCRPQLVLGEQVASKDGLAWLDLVQADLEAESFAFGAVDTCAAGFGAPHIRARLYWMADAAGKGLERYGRSVEINDQTGRQEPDGCGASGSAGSRMADADGGNPCAEREQRSGQQRQQPQDGVAGGVADTSGERREGERLRLQSGRQDETVPETTRRGADGRMDDATGSRHQRSVSDAEGNSRDEARLRVPDAGREPGGLGDASSARAGRDAGAAGGESSEGGQGRPEGGQHVSAGLGDTGADSRPGPLNGLWRDADWLCCTDGKWRPVAPGTFPLAPAGSVVNRVGTLRGAGNAINLAQAVGFIEAVIESREMMKLMA